MFGSCNAQKKVAQATNNYDATRSQLVFQPDQNGVFSLINSSF